jgi:hypothetical protein
MSERARDFVESWKEEYLHPVANEPEGDLSESSVTAAA